MKKILITIYLLTFTLLSFGQSPMDVYESNMKEEYQLHDIANVTNYILRHRELGKSEFIIDGKQYKLKVKKSSLNGGYIKNTTSKDTEWVEGESLQFVVKHMHREYIYNLKGNELELWSDNLSFIAYYNFEEKEVSIRNYDYSYNASSFKMYGYDYSFAGSGLEKVQDWVIRDAIGRANSMGKNYEK